MTPQTLLLALGAILVSGVVLGVFTSLAPSITTASTAGASTAAVDTGESFSPEELGDAEITYPAPTTTTPKPSVAPVPSPSVDIEPTPSVTSSASPASSGTRTPVIPTASTVPSSQSRDARPTSLASDAPRSTTQPTHRPTRVPTPSRRAVTPARVAVVVGGWRAPTVRTGATVLTRPRLSSGAPVSITVACSPRDACVISGDRLVIGVDASSVTVTWSAPAHAGFGAWRVSRAL